MCEDCDKAEATPAPEEPFDRWLREGYEAGWIGPPVCSTHDGVPTSEAEDDEGMEYGEHPCIHVLRLYSSPADKVGVEANHSPSVWRATNAGLS